MGILHLFHWCVEHKTEELKGKQNKRASINEEGIRKLNTAAG